MKKVMLVLIMAILLVGIISVYAKQGYGSQNSNEGNDTQNQDREQEGNHVKITGNKTSFLPWQKRNESECPDECSCHGAVVSCETENGKVMTIEAGRSGNVITITVNKKEVNTTLEIETENETEIEGNRTQNKTHIKVKLSNGRKTEIKIMPDTASEKAIERLGKLNFTIELKEVPVGNNKTAAYELQAERHYKILALFKAKALVKADIDATTGEIIIIKKPWWAFLAKED